MTYTWNNSYRVLRLGDDSRLANGRDASDGGIHDLIYLLRKLFRDGIKQGRVDSLAVVEITIAKSDSFLSLFRHGVNDIDILGEVT